MAKNNLGYKVEFGGAFCMGKFQQDVCVTANDTVNSVTPENIEEFFKKILKQKYKI